MTDNILTSKIKTEEELILEEMMKNGVHYGRAKRYTHPSMRPYLIKSLKNIEIFNLKITYQKLKETVNVLKDFLNNNKKILFVGTTPASLQKIQEIAVQFNQPYINYKWIGGFLTNFSTIQARLLYFKDLLKKEESGELKEYLPKERSRLEKELNKMKMLYSGVVNLENLPDALFIVNLAYPSHLTAKREALKLKIPIIAIAGSDNDLTGVDYFIPANDKAPKSIAFLVDYLIQKLKT
ncbi:MAG: 30S ribosomal protein S2 [Patescibacteria group bacterium]